MAKKKAARKSASRKAPRAKAPRKQPKKSGKRSIVSYEHEQAQRVNNPPVGLVSPRNDPEGGKQTYRYDPHLDPELQFDSQGAEIENLLDKGLAATETESDDPKKLKQALAKAKAALAQLKQRREPYLNWAGKAEHTTFEVPTVSLHVHERIDPRTIIDAVRHRNGGGTGTGPQKQRLLFDDPQENPPLRNAVEFYRHAHNWSNRLVAGDSLLVMNSLLEKEGMAGKVQMIYLDPPYGIRYGSNFQPFVSRRDVKEKDEDLTSEPETLKAFRDTWELGIHSYLTYLRDRLILARELLTASGSVFMQIGDENLHLVRDILDEVFGRKNFVSLVAFKKTGGQSSNLLPGVSDYLLWYARDRRHVKYHQLYFPKIPGEEGAKQYNWVETKTGERRSMTKDEADGEIPLGYQILQPYPLVSMGASSTDRPFLWNGREFLPSPNRHWSVTGEGLSKLAKADRLLASVCL